MKYRLIVVTDGRPALLEQTLSAFLLKVMPAPTEVAVIDDSGDRQYASYLEDLLPSAFPEGVTLLSHPKRLGFCQSVQDGWGYAARPGVDWAYWLEDDFVHTRCVNLEELAFVLEREPQLAQMALYRDPVNAEERRVGGYMNLYPEDYARRGEAQPWWETTRCFTTNPSLFRRELAEKYAFPGHLKFCEGEFGFQLRAEREGTTFGIWGEGQPWVEHIGAVRVGKGY